MQTTSRRLADRKVGRFEKNITKRGAVPETSVKKGKDYPVGPILLGFFIFVVIGSCKTFFLAYRFYHVFSLSVCLICISPLYFGRTRKMWILVFNLLFNEVQRIDDIHSKF